MIILLCIILSYLLGSLCSAVIVSRLFSLPNPCLEGSNNPGATNVLRLAGKKYAIIVLIADLMKGLCPVLLAHYLLVPLNLVAMLGVGAVIGHMYPVFFKFKGGKGVATTFGVLLGFNYLLGILTLLTWLLVAKLTRYSSLAALISITMAPFYSWFLFHQHQGFWPLLAISGLVIYRHQNNIKRLIKGVEPKL